MLERMTMTHSRDPLRSDDYQPPPFAALDVLEEEISALDAWVSNFIGRMQPYSGPESPESMMVGELVQATRDDRSPFEERIAKQISRVVAIRVALDEMNQRLRL